MTTPLRLWARLLVKKYRLRAQSPVYVSVYSSPLYEWNEALDALLAQVPKGHKTNQWIGRLLSRLWKVVERSRKEFDKRREVAKKK